MAPLPKRVKVGPFIYAVTLGTVQEMQTVEGSERALMGHCDHLKLTIYIREDMVEQARQEVLLHEVLHACSNAAGNPFAVLTSVPADETEELAVTTIAPSLLQVLRANPALVAYLLGT